jgi:hypothetical protein
MIVELAFGEYDMKETIIIEVMKKLGGFFGGRDNIYLGGSTATNFATGLDMDIVGNDSDIDIFILQPKRMERWAYGTIMDVIFNAGIEIASINEEYNKIGNQYMLVKAKHKLTDGSVLLFDVIFADITVEELISNYSASDLAKFYYKINYSEQPELKLITPKDTLDALISFAHGACCVYPEKSTEKQLEKIIYRCNKNNLTVVEK